MSYRDRISRDPQVLRGGPVFKGTRVPLSVVLSHLAAEHSVEHILQEFPSLAAEDVSAAIAYAAVRALDEDIEPRRQPVIGTAKGQVKIHPSFFEPDDD